MKESKWMQREFQGTFLTALFGLLTTLGIFCPDEADAMKESVHELLGAIMIGASSLSYLVVRVWHKIADLRSTTNLQVVEADLRIAEINAKVELARIEASVRPVVASTA